MNLRARAAAILLAIALLMLAPASASAQTQSESFGTPDQPNDITLYEQGSLPSQTTYMNRPGGVYSDGTTIWVVETAGTTRVWAFDHDDQGYNADKSFTTTNAGRQVGIWSDGTDILIATRNGGAAAGSQRVSVYDAETGEPRKVGLG